MTIIGNDISCDRFGCRKTDTFVGELSAADVRTRYHILGWQTLEINAEESHMCPRHATTA